MGTEKNIQLGILFIDIILLSAFIIGFYHFMLWIDPALVDGIKSLPWLVATYVTCFIGSFSIYPSIIQTRLVRWESVVTRVLATCFMMLLFISLVTLITHAHPTFPLRFFFFSIIVTPFLVCIIAPNYLKAIHLN